MNIIRQNAFYGLFVILLGTHGTSMAQEVAPLPPLPPMVGVPAIGPAQIGVVRTGGMAISMQDSAEVVKNQPYQAEAVTEVKQTLADGSHIKQTTTATVARDSEGRTVRVQKLGAMGPWKSASDSSQASAPTLTTIFDPVAQAHIDYSSENKVAHSLPVFPPMAKMETNVTHSFGVFAGGPGADGPGPVTNYAFKTRTDSAEATSANIKTESLGDKAIDGISVTGTKTTNTIPAGTIGNDKDLVVTRETWYSPDLKLVIQSTQNDPRFGETTYSLTNIERNEPDLSLFQVPAGYKVEKVPGTIQTR